MHHLPVAPVLLHPCCCTCVVAPVSLQGHQMLQSMGWHEGGGLGSAGAGITEPVAAGRLEHAKSGLGAETPHDPNDSFLSYRQNKSKSYSHRNTVLNSGPQNNFMPGTVPPPKESKR